MDPRLFTPEEAAARRAEAARLTSLLEAHPGFSYLRFGDGELAWALLAQEDNLDQWRKFSYAEDPKALRQAYCVAGLRPDQFGRMMQSFSACGYLDKYDRQDYCRENLPKLRDLKRADAAEGNPTAQVSMIFYEWVAYEMPAYVTRHKCLFVGAEAPLLAELWEQPGYRKAAERFFPPGSEPVFIGVREGGRNYAENLDLILADIRRQAQEHGAHTVFIALATGAKIICQELAAQTGLRTFDFGSMLRALTYSGTPGHQAHPSSHCPYFFTVPLADYMQAWERTAPQASALERVRKMHGQLGFDLLSKVPMGSFATDWATPGSLDLSAENLRLFKVDFSEYKRRLAGLLKKVDAAARRVEVKADHQRFMQALHWVGATRWGRFKRRMKKILKGGRG